MKTKFGKAQSAFIQLLKRSPDNNELMHARNTLFWLKQLDPQADEILQLAALAHDIERSASNPVSPKDYHDYSEYKFAHAKKSGQIAFDIILDVGYTALDCKRISRIIESAEFESLDPEIQLLCDADSISFFDNNLELYLKKKGLDKTVYKVVFMYDRASDTAKNHIDSILVDKGLEQLISDLSR